MRGEDETLREGFELAKETPPHAWGRPPLLHARLYRGRNTPTCVGKTGDDKQVVALRWKHPHMRGEDPERSLNFFLHTWY